MEPRSQANITESLHTDVPKRNPQSRKAECAEVMTEVPSGAVGVRPCRWGMKENFR